MKTIVHFGRVLIIALCAVLQASVAFSANYYWIGGSGNWDDLNHWATASGGNINQVQIPTAQDDVFFDANSFLTSNDTVNININPALCNNMNWSGAKFNPTLAGATSSSVKIFGSLTLISQMNYIFGGIVNFEAINSGMTIKSAGHQFLNNVNFNGAGGEWTLSDNFSVKTALIINFGTLITNNLNVTAGSFKSTGNKNRSLILGSSLFTITDAGVSAFSADFLNFGLIAGTSTIRFTYNGSNIVGLNVQNANTDATFHNVEFSGSDATDSVVNATNYSLIFNNLTFNTHGRFRGNNTINGTLKLTPGKIYIFRTGSTQTINGSISANGNCIDYITIESSSYMGHATFHKSSGTINTDRLLIENIHATGSASWNATNSIKIYNVTGWNTTNPVNYGANYYWIGGTGNWSDPSHWSLSSGGPPNAAGCIPQSVNNVYFDAKSFNASGQSVNIDMLFASCKDMNWTGALFTPSFSGAVSNNLKIFGSLKFIPAMKLALYGITSFEAKTMGKTITSAGNHFISMVDFCGDGGGWKFLDDFFNASTLCLTLGNLNTNNYMVTIYKFESTVDYYRTLTLGSSLVNITSPVSDAFTADFTNFTFLSGVSKIRFTSNSITVGMTADISPNDVVFYNVEFSDSVSNATVSNYTGKSFVFNNLSFAGNGIITGDNIYNGILTLSPGKSYSFEATGMQTINGSISANGACGNTIIIQSTLNGVSAIFTKSGGSVNINNVTLKDNFATGGAVWNAAGSVILSNTTGWNVTPPSNNGINYYWIGGTGNWSDPNHWSLSSGGPPNNTGCIPGYSNNVYFDNNSFSGTNQTVTIDVNPAVCNDMVWTGAQYTPTLWGASVKSLKIYGSLTFINAMKQSFFGQVFFEATTPNKTIRTGGMKFNNYISFNGIGGSWIIQDSLTSSSKVNLLYGGLNTNSKPVTISTFYSNTNTIRNLTLGASVFTITGGGYTGFNVDFTNMSFNAGNSTIKFSYNSGNVGMTIVAATSDITFRNVVFTGSLATGYIRNQSGKSAIFNNVTFSGDAYNSGNNTFNDVIIIGSGIINGTNTFHDLTFTAGETYTLQAGLTQTVQNNWWVQGKCTSYIMLYSSSNGYPAYVSKASGTVNGFLIHIRDIHCTGGATFYAYNSVDLGGISGWDFLSLPFMANLTNVIGPTKACAGQNTYTYYVPSTGALSYLWTVPANATIVSGQNDTTITVNFPSVSTGNISVYAFNGCGYSLPSVLSVTIYPTPVADAGTDQAICSGASATLIASGGDTYLWSNGSASSSITVNPSNSSNYIVTATATVSGCFSADTVLVNVDPTPVLTFVAPQSVCFGESADLTAAGGNTYLWSNNDTNSTVTVNPAITTTYSVTASLGNCQATGDVTLTVNPLPTADAGQDQTICSGNSAYLSASGGGTYIWSNNDSTQNISVYPTNNITYTVTVTSNGCSASDDVAVNVNPSPVADAGQDQSICSGQSVNLFANGGFSYTWSPLNSLNAGNIPNPVATPAVSTEYTVTASASNGCTASAQVTVTVIPMPVANAGSDITVCKGSDVVLSASGGAAFMWSNGDNGASITITPDNTSTYTVTVSNSFCTSTDDVTLTVLPLPNVTFYPDINSGCNPLSVSFYNNSTPDPLVYNWHFGDGLTSDVKSPSHVYTSHGKYDVTLTVTDINGCKNSLSIDEMIEVYPTPEIDFTWSPDNANVLNSNLFFTSTSDFSLSEWSWNFGDNTSGLNSSDISNPMHFYQNSGSYNVLLWGQNNYGCFDTAMHVVTVKDITTFWIPNAFTPDNDGTNDEFGPVINNRNIQEFNFMVFDRWGEIIFQTDNPQKKWDGMQRGGSEPAPGNVYVWKALYKADSQRAIEETGMVTLIR